MFLKTTTKKEKQAMRRTKKRRAVTGALKNKSF
jgi:hypothetical protein